MKVILLQNVPKIGKKFEQKVVSDGYATNFLIPRGLAEIATESSVSRIMLRKSQSDTESKIHEDLLLKNLHDLEGVRVEMTESANDKGHLFAGIHAEEMIPAIKEQTRLEVLPEHIVLDKPIKAVGEHQIPVTIQNTTVTFTLVVNAK